MTVKFAITCTGQHPSMKYKPYFMDMETKTTTFPVKNKQIKR